METRRSSTRDSGARDRLAPDRVERFVWRDGDFTITHDDGSLLERVVTLHDEIRVDDEFVVLEANPNHDPKTGRFAKSAGGARSSLKVLKVELPRDYTERFRWSDGYEHALLYQTVPGVQQFSGGKYVANGKWGQCHRNSLAAFAKDPAEGVYVGIRYDVSKRTSDGIIAHAWNVKDGQVIEHSPIYGGSKADGQEYQSKTARYIGIGPIPKSLLDPEGQWFDKTLGSAKDYQSFAKRIAEHSKRQTEATLVEYNPRHDKLGRFATADHSSVYVPKPSSQGFRLDRSETPYGPRPGEHATHPTTGWQIGQVLVTGRAGKAKVAGVLVGWSEKDSKYVHVVAMEDFRKPEKERRTYTYTIDQLQSNTLEGHKAIRQAYEDKLKKEAEKKARVHEKALADYEKRRVAGEAAVTQDALNDRFKKYSTSPKDVDELLDRVVESHKQLVGWSGGGRSKFNLTNDNQEAEDAGLDPRRLAGIAKWDGEIVLGPRYSDEVKRAVRETSINWMNADGMKVLYHEALHLTSHKRVPGHYFANLGRALEEGLTENLATSAFVNWVTSLGFKYPDTRSQPSATYQKERKLVSTLAEAASHGTDGKTEPGKFIRKWKYINEEFRVDTIVKDIHRTVRRKGQSKRTITESDIRSLLAGYDIDPVKEAKFYTDFERLFKD